MHKQNMSVVSSYAVDITYEIHPRGAISCTEWHINEHLSKDLRST